MSDLLKALMKGNYNAKPSKLRQGSISAVFYDENGKEREGTEEEWNLLYEEAGFTSKFRRGLEVLGLSDEGAAMVFDTSIPNIRRWRSGEVIPPAYRTVLHFLEEELKK